MGDVTDQEIKEMLQRLRQERAVRDARNEAYLKNNPNRGLLVQLGDSIDKFLDRADTSVILGRTKRPETLALATKRRSLRGR